MEENNNIENELTQNEFNQHYGEQNINMNNEGNLQKENNEEEEEKKNHYWIIYILIVIIIFIIILLLLRGCNSIRSKKYSQVVAANDWVTNMWNKCVDPIYWYTVDGTGIEGAAINIDNVLKDCDTYYNEYKSHSKNVNSLSEDDKEFKDYYNKIMEQIDVIYPKIKASKPVAKEATDYEENIEIFYEYQVKLYNLVKEKYVEAE